MQVLKTSFASPRTSSIEATNGSEDSNESTDYNQAAGTDPPTIGTVLWSHSFLIDILLAVNGESLTLKLSVVFYGETRKFLMNQKKLWALPIAVVLNQQLARVCIMKPFNNSAGGSQIKMSKTLNKSTNVRKSLLSLIAYIFLINLFI